MIENRNIENEYTRYFGYRCYKLVETHWSAIIDLMKIDKPIGDFMCADGFISIKKFEQYLKDNVMSFAVPMSEVYDKCRREDIRCLENQYILHLKKRYYTVANISNKNLVFDLLNVKKPISDFLNEFNQINKDDFILYLIKFVPFEIDESVSSENMLGDIQLIVDSFCEEKKEFDISELQYELNRVLEKYISNDFCHEAKVIAKPSKNNPYNINITLICEVIQ